MLLSKYPYTASHSSPPLKNLRVSSPQKRAANLSSIHNPTREELSISHEDPGNPCLHASTPTFLRRNSVRPTTDTSASVASRANNVPCHSWAVEARAPTGCGKDVCLA
ncbi:hypothetical protein VE01_01408 [Pseudogymnoascus verrucosus]|uniref:Uncharacterized protein n=1 Tax=Pseudogymnoascus verrucosus TaxID=342668 RepID=A0A1B8GWQ0_9PEZI|nr:uncharacterized protein VE01_01408 [Pseudogymnoascus verrucosus]OBU00258.1 hypothetical protein VE01_01408 [Pseudogymnoascus verrucosus]